MNRRTLITTTSLALPALLLGCGTSSTTITSAETDLLLVTNTAIQIAGILAPTNPTFARMTNGVNEPLDLAKAALTALIAGNTPAAGSPTTPAQIISILSADLSALAPVIATAAPSSAPYVIAAEVVLASAGALLNVIVPAPVSPVTAKLKTGETVAYPIPTYATAKQMLLTYTHVN